jgi:integrase
MPAEPTLGWGRAAEAPVATRASDVTRGAIAEQSRTSGAADARVATKRQAPPAGANVIDGNFDGEAQRNVAEASGDDAYVDELVGRARAILFADGEKREQPSESTMADYQAKCRFADDAMATMQEPDDHPLRLFLARYASSKGSYHAMQAALRWRLRCSIEARLKELHRLRSEPGQRVRFAVGLTQLEWDCVAAELLEQTKRAQFLDDTGPASRRGRSKKHVLKHLEPDWRSRFLAQNASSPTYREAGVVMAACGLRPEELQSGVKVEPIGPHVKFTIKGAKVTKTAGQEERSMLALATSLPRWFVSALGFDGKTISAKKDAMRKHLARLSAKLYPRRQADVILSAYVFRHALATDLRDDGWDIEEIAAVLGETVAETSMHYGLRPRAPDRVRVKPVVVRGSVITTKPVRPPDHTFVDKVKARHAARRVAGS